MLQSKLLTKGEFVVIMGKYGDCGGMAKRVAVSRETEGGGVEMKPCPFCGGEGEVRGYLGEYWVECKRCPCALGKCADNAGEDYGEYKSKEEAEAGWDKRWTLIVRRKDR